MHLLPLSLGRLADHAARSGGPRYPLGTVLLRLAPDNTFEAVATDTRSLVRVTGPCVAPAADYPIFPDLAAAPDDGPSPALIPVDVWKSAFAFVRKLTSRAQLDPVLRCVAVRLGESGTTFGATDGLVPWVESAEHATGRYVPYESVTAALLAVPPADQFDVDPVLFGNLLRTAAEFVAERAAPRVRVETRGPRQPVVVRAGKPGGIEFFGMLMPLVT